MGSQGEILSNVQRNPPRRDIDAGEKQVNEDPNVNDIASERGIGEAGEEERPKEIPSVEFSFRSHSRLVQAFTLIELLVVIAIIAILAAILFPVFAQSKKMAKASTALSHAKQIGLAHIMYANDYDDLAMMGGQWGSQDPDRVLTGPGAGFLPWPALAEPYIKSNSLFVTPLAPKTEPFFFSATNRCNNDRSCIIRYPQFGYNVTHMAPWKRYPGDPTFTPQPISYTGINKPAQQVLLVEIWTRSTCPATTAWGSTNGIGQITFAEAPAPDKKNAPNAYGYAIPTWGHGWGNDGASNLAYATIPTAEEGKYTGGVAFRVTSLTSVVFADSHVKRMNPNQLAEGTNWSLATKDMNSNTITNLRNEKYMWHPDGL